jgi:nucleoside-diphosphate-sugar epimerase
VFDPLSDKTCPILVTGAGGFIGGHVVRALLDLGFTRVRAADKKPLDQWFQAHAAAENHCFDLSQPQACAIVARGCAWVFHFACEMGGIGFIETHRTTCLRNVLIDTHMIHQSALAGVRRFFYASTACVYNTTLQSGSKVKPLTESDAYPAFPEGGYGWAKLFGEQLATEYAHDYPMETRIARFHNIYGPYGSFDDGREKAPAALCRKAALGALGRTDQMEIWGDGDQIRSFLYIDDALEGIFKLMASHYGEAVNLGSEAEVTILALADVIEAIAGTRLKRTHHLGAPQGVRTRNSDSALARQVLDWQPRVPLSQGLEKTYHWIFDQMRSRFDSHGR